MRKAGISAKKCLLGCPAFKRERTRGWRATWRSLVSSYWTEPQQETERYLKQHPEKRNIR